MMSGSQTSAIVISLCLHSVALLWLWHSPAAAGTGILQQTLNEGDGLSLVELPGDADVQEAMEIELPTAATTQASMLVEQPAFAVSNWESATTFPLSFVSSAPPSLTTGASNHGR